MKLRRKFQPDNPDGLYGLTPPNVDGLTAEVKHGTRQGQPYRYICYRDEQGVKWKIVAWVTHNGRVQSVSLQHRNSWGRRGFHAQSVRAWGNPKGVKELVAYIRRHEAYEKRRESELSVLLEQINTVI